MKIVITGGPCAGKTTVLEALKKELPGVNFVNEVATTLFNEGYPAPNPWTQEWQNGFQKAIFDRQIQEETTVRGITIFDRGLGDGAAYDSNFWNRFNLTKEDIWNRYDYIIILRSLAFLDPEKYVELQKSNPHRFESPERALELDQKILDIYKEHPNAFVSDGNLETTINHIKEIVG